MEGGGPLWFWALGGGIVLLGLVMAYASVRRRKPGGDPNAAWKEAAAESGHPEVADPKRVPNR